MRSFLITVAFGSICFLSPAAAQDAQNDFEGVWQYSSRPSYGALKIEGSRVEFFAGDGVPVRCGALLGTISTRDATGISGSWSGQCEDLSAIGHFAISREGDGFTMNDCVGLASGTPSCELGTYFKELYRVQ